MVQGIQKVHLPPRSVGLILFWVSLALIAYFSTAEHILLSTEAFIFNDDVRQQIWPMLRYADPTLFPNDYVADYYLTTFLPAGYRALYEGLAPCLAPRIVSKVLPYVLLPITLVAVGRSSWLLGGPAAAWISVAIILTADVYLSRMTGGVPRAFAFPLVGLLVLGLVSGRPMLVSAATMAGALFYYVVAAVGGLLLFALLFVVPPTWRGAARSWTLTRRSLTLGLTGFICVLVVLPSLVAGRRYGQHLSQRHVLEFPEAGIGGRYSAIDLPIAGNGVYQSIESGARTFGGGRILNQTLHDSAMEGRRFLTALVVVVLLLGVGQMWRHASAKRITVMIPVVLVGYYAAALLTPYLFLPGRYLEYTMPIIVATAFPAALLTTARRVPGYRDLPGGEAIGAALALILILLLAGGPEAGRGLAPRPTEPEIYQAIARLPEDAVVAGWPSGAVQNVPYLAARSAFVTYETHQAFHREYALEMRRRTEALIDAYITLDHRHLIALREQWGVTHLLLDRREVSEAGLEHFKPFDENIRLALSTNEPATPEERISSFEEEHIAYRDAKLALVDLRRLPSPQPR